MAFNTQAALAAKMIRRTESVAVPELAAWFGDEAGIRDCAAAVRVQRGFVAEEDGAVVGFCTVELRDPGSAEITWMAVRADRRNLGVGTALVEARVERLAAEGVRRLLVKTLSERDPYPPYGETRRFYSRRGFVRVAELDVWGPDNPAVLLARSL